MILMCILRILSLCLMILRFIYRSLRFTSHDFDVYSQNSKFTSHDFDVYSQSSTFIPQPCHSDDKLNKFHCQIGAHKHVYRPIFSSHMHLECSA